jgi:hypothetical protein
MDPKAQPSTRLRLFLRDFRMVEATISLSPGQSLTSWLANRKSYVNLRGAHWASTNDHVQHAVLKVQQVLWAASMDGDIPLMTAMQPMAPRVVEIQLDGGLLVRGGLNVGERQRLSDYLESQAQFIPVRNAMLLRSGRPPKEVNVTLGDVVLNQEAVQAVWEIETSPIEGVEPANAVAHS